MEPGAICWYELATPDLAGADDFYSTVFGWRVHEAESAPGDPYFEFRHNDDAVAGLVPIDHRFPSRDMPAHWTVCFMVDDCVQSCERAADLGGVVARKPMTVATGWYARLSDPQGAHFAIIELAEELRMDF
jgi:predicted enzyme related to lactoylglutathione lyase